MVILERQDILLLVVIGIVVVSCLLPLYVSVLSACVTYGKTWALRRLFGNGNKRQKNSNRLGGSNG